jgi:hypothetical protein
LGDKIRAGPTPVNKLIVDGIIVGRDDMDNILLLDTTAIRSIPKKTVLEVATVDVIKLNQSMTLKEAARILTHEHIEGAPVTDDEGKVSGILTLSDITRALADGKEKSSLTDLMSKNLITVEKDVMIAEAIEIMNKNRIGRLIVVDTDGTSLGIVTRTDLLDKIAGIK